MKGIILAGGKGSRLKPLTNGVSKQMLPVFNKPMIYYPLSTLMLAGIKDILIISGEEQLPIYKEILSECKHIGLNIEFAVQDQPRGLPEAFIIGEEFIGDDNVCLILGDNLFYGQGFSSLLKKACDNKSGGTIFGYPVGNPESFGVAEVEDGKVISLEEKPKQPKSNLAVTGLYFFDSRVSEFAKNLKPSARGELEIVDIQKKYLENSELNFINLGRGFAWLDMGTHESLLDAGNYVRAIESRQGINMACIEEIALNNGWTTVEELKQRLQSLNIENNYYNYINKLLS